MTDNHTHEDQDTPEVLEHTEKVLELSDEDDLPDLTPWQETAFERMEKDIRSGVFWHPATFRAPTSRKPKASSLREELRMEVASWFLTVDNKYIKVDDPEARLGMNDIARIAKQKMFAYYHDTPFAKHVDEKTAGEIVYACMMGEPIDPRMAFGIWSGKIYPAPGNPSRRLYRNDLWDLNSWSRPTYRQHREYPSYGALKPFLDFAVPDGQQQGLLLDWIAWSLQNEASKPNWAVLLFSEEKGTGKSTIGVVCESLFGAANTAKIDGVDKLVATHNDRVLDKKLIIAEEVHISSNSDTGNKLKDLITSDRTTVNPKYLPMKTIPLKACYMFTTNHKPLWMEGGERRYYIIEMSHDGHAQGPRSDEFTQLVGAVMEQVNDPEQLSALYEALMRRRISPEFDPKSLKFGTNATPIMRELQALSGNEGDEVLEALLAEFNVAIIPSADFRPLVKYLNARNDTALRNALVRLGWEDDRLRLNGKQQRVWRKKGLMLENKRVCSPDLAETLEGAVENGFVWFPLGAYIDATWQGLLTGKLDRHLQADLDRSVEARGEDAGPFLDSSTKSASYQAWTMGRGKHPAPPTKFLRVEDEL